MNSKREFTSLYRAFWDGECLWYMGVYVIFRWQADDMGSIAPNARTGRVLITIY